MPLKKYKYRPKYNYCVLLTKDLRNELLSILRVPIWQWTKIS